MVEKKSLFSNMTATVAATGGLITAIVGLLTFMSSPAPSIDIFDASPNIISIGDSSILKWSVTGKGAIVNIEPDIGVVGLSGNREITPTITTNYTLTARTEDQERFATIRLIVREKEKDDQLDYDQVSSVVSQSDSTMPPDAKDEPDQDQVYGSPPLAEKSNPDEFGAIDQSKMSKDTVAAPASVIVADNYMDQDYGSKPPSAGANEPDYAVSEPIAIEESANEPTSSDETPDIAANGIEANSDGSDTGSEDVGSNEPKTTKVITAADWNRLNCASESENDFASKAPIYAKIGSNLSASSSDPYIQVLESNQDLAGSDYLGPI